MQTLRAPAPSGRQTEQPAQRTAQAQKQPACPSGSVSAALDSIQFEWRYSTLPNEVTVVGRGTLHNGTSAAIKILEHDVPNLDGLDSRGQNATIALYGEYDWAPPPGVPSGGYVVVQPGGSVTYTVKDPTLASMIVPVTHWYSATDLGSVQMYYETASSLCSIAGMPEGSGKAIPNIFTPQG
jgi:hypothetical protein